MNQLISYIHTDDLLRDTRSIIDAAQQQAYYEVNRALVQRNWLMGKLVQRLWTR
ncbi:MAG: hypothetical protein IK127_06135 [Clostridia bacterium]|nr:hypothetical protein [Clostridia bacterium]